MNRVDKLLTSNTGYSTKAFALVLGIIDVFLISISFVVMLFIDLFSEKYTIDSDMTGMAAVIGALDAMVAWFYYSKVKGEKSEKSVDKQEKEE